MARPNTGSLAELMNHPAGRFKKPLIWLRSLQVLFGLVEFIVVCTALSQGLQAAAERKDIQATSRNSLTYRDIIEVVAMLGVMLVVTFACVAISSLWLYYTVRPAARNRSCGCWRSQCHSYDCDFGWDITWSVLWGVYFIAVCVYGGRMGPLGAAIAAGLFTFIMLGSFIAAAAVNSRVRRDLRWAQTFNQDVECTSGPMMQSPGVAGFERVSQPSSVSLQLSHTL